MEASLYLHTVCKNGTQTFMETILEKCDEQMMNGHLKLESGFLELLVIYMLLMHTIAKTVVQLLCLKNPPVLP